MKRKAFTLIELLVVVAIIALLISILLPSLSRARELAKRAVCGSNNSQIGKSSAIYRQKNNWWYPIHFYDREGAYDDSTLPITGGVRYVGTMGSNSYIKISERTGEGIPNDAINNTNHPSRSLFLMVIDGASNVGGFVCPSSSDRDDDLRNYGADRTSGTSDESEHARPGKNRFDFQGYDRLSYGYQVPYGKRGRLRDSADPRMPVCADKGPYYQADPGADSGDTRTVPDVRNDDIDPPDWTGDEVVEILKRPNEDWRPYNSQNHNGEGQEVLFHDGHAEFTKKPISGIDNDNIYTAADNYIEQQYSMVGQVDSGDDMWAPTFQTDSYLVP